MRPATRPIPPLIPAPLEFQYDGAESDAFTFDAGVEIRLGPAASPETLFAADQLEAAAQWATGLSLSVRTTAAAAGEQRRLALTLTGRDPTSTVAPGPSGTLAPGPSGGPVAHPGGDSGPKRGGGSVAGSGGNLGVDPGRGSVARPGGDSVADPGRGSVGQRGGDSAAERGGDSVATRGGDLTADPGGDGVAQPGGDPAADADAGREAYVLRVTSNAIEVEASSEAGLFYAVQTLRQLLQTYGARIPALTIRDRPMLAHRGLMLDVSRGKVPTLATLFELVDRLAAYKYNQLQLYIEHTFHFPSHPAIGAGTDPLTAEDILALDAYCRQRHVELVPNLQSFGHQRHLLSLADYSHLDEVGWRWSLSPAREETYQFLDELYADFLPAFSSGWLNVDCDETWDLGTGQSKTLAMELGKGRLYLRHILRLRELAAKHGRRIMLWADVLRNHPELVPELPDDVLLLDWEYEAADHYPTTTALGTSGRTFWVCPGTSSWNTLFPRLDNALVNIRRLVGEGLDAGATGMILTDWGDYGHYQALSLSWYAYLFGAATAWTGARTSPEEFDAAFAPLFLGQPAGDAALRAMRRLGTAVSGPTLGLRNRSAIALALFDDPLSGGLQTHVDVAALAELNAAATDAIRAFATLPDASLRHDYGFAARLIAFATARVQAALHVRETLGALAHRAAGSARADALARLDQDIAALAAGRAQVPALRSEFESRWLEHARPSEIRLTLAHFEQLERSYDAALAWLDEQRARYAAGQAVDADVATYTPSPVPLLWQQGSQQLRTLADLAGIDALPDEVAAVLHHAPD
jgi:hexosaminidase